MRRTIHATMRGALTGLLLLGTLVAGASLLSAPGEPARDAYAPLEEEAMSGLLGGGACKDCRYAGARLDECYHDSLADPCLSDTCIANYCLEDTCDPGEGTCNAWLDQSKVGVMQYCREDSACTVTNQYTWVVWQTHYYGSDCAENLIKVRCQKTTGQCNGTLIDSAGRTPGVTCAY